MALFLLDHGADPRLHSEFDGLTPLQAARRAGLAAVEQRLYALGLPPEPEPPAPRAWVPRWWPWNRRR